MLTMVGMMAMDVVCALHTPTRRNMFALPLFRQAEEDKTVDKIEINAMRSLAIPGEIIETYA